MSGNRGCVFEDGDDHNVKPIVDDGNIEPSVFSIRNALEQPNARVYMAMDLHSKSQDSVLSVYALQPMIFLVLIHHGKIDLDPPYQQGEYFVVSSSIALKHTKAQALSGLRKNRWESSIRYSTTSTSPLSSLP